MPHELESKVYGLAHCLIFSFVLHPPGQRRPTRVRAPMINFTNESTLLMVLSSVVRDARLAHRSATSKLDNLDSPRFGTRTRRKLSIVCAVSAVPWYGQCGGIGYEGPTNCDSGSLCEELNEYYSMVRLSLGSSSLLACSMAVVRRCTVQAWPPLPRHSSEAGTSTTCMPEYGTGQ